MEKTRKKAIESGETRYYTGLACKHGHKAERWTMSGACVACQEERRAYNKVIYETARNAN